MQGVQNIDGSNLLDGIKGAAGNSRQDNFDLSFVSTGADQSQETEKLTKGERTSQVTYQKPQQENKAGSMEDVMQQAENMNAELMKKQMVVASNTTTATDCQKMDEDGFSLQRTEAKTVVTVTDKIKMELAKAGVDISYFGDDLSAEQLEKLAGSEALAKDLAGRIDQLQADIPLTADNVADCKKALQEAEELHKLNDGAIKYLLDNQLEPTIANLYMAQFSGSASYTNENNIYINFHSPGIRDQISSVIAQAGLEVNEGAFADSQWLIENQVPLTAGNLKYYGQLKEAMFPPSRDSLLNGMITAIAEGKRPQDAVLLDSYSLSEKAQNAAGTVNIVSDEDLAYLIQKGEPVTIENLQKAHNLNQSGALNAQERQTVKDLIRSVSGLSETDINAYVNQAAHSDTSESIQQTADTVQNSASGNLQAHVTGNVNQQANAESDVRTDQTAVYASSDGSAVQTAGSPGAGADSGSMADGRGGMAQHQAEGFTSVQILLITARRQLEEVRLVMTVESSYIMYKQGISVDTASMEELISRLKEIENSYYKNLLTEGGVEATEVNVSLFAETSTKLEQLKEMPAYAIGAHNIGISTLEELHQEGGAMQQSFQQANERYETMRTPVREDLGDSIKKAFRNVDEILKDTGMEVTPANERAVRILGYNRIEITPENITRMKAADQQVQMAFHNLTPAVVREFINRGMNPLDLDIRELNRQAAQIREELKIDVPEEKYSEYLYKLEQNHSITQEERSSYIGIYRLMNHIVQSDGAAVGALVNQGAQITMRNLLAAVRSERRGSIDIQADASFGGLESGGIQNSITKQIEAGYQQQCVKQAFHEMSPERLRVVSDDTGWEDLTPEQFLQQLQEAPEDTAAMESYYQQQLDDLTACAKSSGEVYEMLEQYDIPNTVMNVMAVSEYLNNRNGAFRRFFNMGSGRTPDANKNTDAYMTKNEDGSTEVDFAAIQEELLRRFGEDVKKPEELAQAVAELAECAEKCMSTMIMEPDVTSLDVRELKLMNAQISFGTKMASEECFSMPIVVDGEVTNVTMKIVRNKEQRGLVNITLETSRFGKIAAELKAKKNGFSGYVASDSRQTRDYLQSVQDEIEQALHEIEDAPVDIHYVFTGGLNLNEFAAKSGSSVQPEKENEEMREVQTKTLYGMAEGFIRVLKKLDRETVL